MTKKKHTFCRICEPMCPMLAEVDEESGRVLALKPDSEHPSGSKPCHKGILFLDIHNDPDRPVQPERRTNPRSEDEGQFEAVSWDVALSDIGQRIRSIQEEYGKNAIAVYSGNASGFDGRSVGLANGFAALIGSQMQFSAVTQDTSNKVVAAAHIYGSMAAFMAADLYHTDYLISIGSNPKVSHWALSSVPNDSGATLKKIKARGGKIRFVNPRKTESSTESTGETVLIKPGTDVYFLASLINEVFASNGFDQSIIDQFGKNIDGLIRFISQYPATETEAVTGIAAQIVREIAEEFIAAPSAVCHMSVGVNMSRQGVLAYWLCEMLNFVTGNLGREGGSFKPNGLLDFFPPITTDTKVLHTSVGELEIPDPLGYMVLPGAILSDLIASGEIKALISLGGNPVLSLPGGDDNLRIACEKLDLMVSVDISRSATATISDYVLPATDWLEREDFTFYPNGLQQFPYVQYTDKMAAPAGQRQTDWWILSRLLQEIGIPSPLDDPENQNGFKDIDGLLNMHGLSLDELKAKPSQTHVIPRAPQVSVYERCMQHPDKRVDCCPAAFERVGLFTRCESIFEELKAEPEHTLKLVTLRTNYMHNSWMSNVRKFRKRIQTINPLYMCTDDAEHLDLLEGDSVRVFNDNGSVVTRLAIMDELRPGAVGMTHGYGNKKSFGLKTAQESPGVNCNDLLPSGKDTYEPLSFMAWLSAVPVQIEKAAEDSCVGQ